YDIKNCNGTHLIAFSSSLVEPYFFDGLNSSSAPYLCRKSLHKHSLMMKTGGYVFLFMHLVLFFAYCKFQQALYGVQLLFCLDQLW
uniref:Uncharacterized protein n=1 Tax=Wuchereria bancrofti TaxID=6293 RepID=A0AAF5Q0E7_WUCBA